MARQPHNEPFRKRCEELLKEEARLKDASKRRAEFAEKTERRHRKKEEKKNTTRRGAEELKNTETWDYQMSEDDSGPQQSRAAASSDEPMPSRDQEDWSRSEKSRMDGP